MARLRTRAKRSFLLAVALALLALLLEMNRFLPGSWPGGDGGGQRAAKESGPRDNESPRKKDDPAAPEDPQGVRAPDAAPPDWPPKTGVPIQLRSAEGSLETSWRLGVGDGGSENGEPNEDGRFRSRDRRLLEEGFRIRTEGRLVRHRNGLLEPASAWVVFRPRSPLPRQRQPGPLDVQVVDAASGEALPDSQLTLRGLGSAQTHQSGGDGRVEVPLRTRVGLVEATVSSAGHDPRTVLLSTRDPAIRQIALDRRINVPLQIVMQDGSDAAIEKSYVLPGDGGPVTSFRGNRPTLQLREKGAGATWLEIHVVVDPERKIIFPFRTRWQPGMRKVEVPAHRVLPLSVRDPNGMAVADALVRAQFSNADGATREEEPVHRKQSALTDARGRAHLAVPVDAPYTVIIEAPNGAPQVRRFAAGDGTAPLEIITESGVQIPVRVRGPGGAPLGNAEVVARASVLDARIVRSAKAGANGRARVGPLPEGPVEIFARAPGHGWGAVVQMAASAMGTVELSLPAGYALDLVVADPFGVPLAGVRAEVTAADGGRALVFSPRETTWLSDSKGRLRIPDLPLRSYNVTLLLPGFGSETLHGLTPGPTRYFATLVRPTK